eukprot:473457-Amphidinium_carterae.1
MSFPFGGVANGSAPIQRWTQHAINDLGSLGAHPYHCDAMAHGAMAEPGDGPGPTVRHTVTQRRHQSFGLELAGPLSPAPPFPAWQCKKAKLLVRTDRKDIKIVDIVANSLPWNKSSAGGTSRKDPRSASACAYTQFLPRPKP